MMQFFGPIFPKFNFFLINVSFGALNLKDVEENRELVK